MQIVGIMVECLHMNTNPKENYKYIHHALLRACSTAIHLLQKAADFAKEKNMSDEELLSEKLAPDMFDLKKQFQIFADNVAGGIARAAQVERPSFPDTEKTIADLIERIEKVKAFVSSVDPDTIADPSGVKVKMGWMPEGMYFDSHAYISDYIIQNSFFHLVTAYGILRHKGANIGKQDYMGLIEMKKEGN